MGSIAFALLCSVLSQGQLRDQPQRDQPSAGAASISGRVAAAGTGVPVQGAVIVLVTFPIVESQSSGRSLEAGRYDGRNVMTDASGTFSFTGVAPGAYRLIVSPAFHQGRYLPVGHGATRPNDAGRTITVRAGEDIRDLTLTLPTGVAIEGRVVDEAGEPLSRMTVIAARVMAGSDAAQRIGHEPSTTDDLGRYRIYGLEPGEYLVAVEGRALPVAAVQPGAHAVPTEQEMTAFLTTFHPSALVESSAQRIQLAPGRDAVGIDIAVVRARRFRLSGMVLDSQGVPVAAANGVLSRAGTIGSTSHAFSSDAMGRFTVAAAEPGEYTLAISGRTPIRPAGSTGPAENAELTMTLATDLDDVMVITQPGITLSGRVVLADTAPASAPELRIVFRRGDGSMVRSPDIEATIDEGLRFQAADVFGPRLVRVSGLPDGWALKGVMLNGADITDVPTVFTKARDGQLEVVLSSRLSTLEGIVRDDAGKAIDDATVYVFSEDRRSWSLASPRTVYSDVRPDGRFIVGGLAAGRYFAIAVAREGARMPQAPREAFFELLSKEATPFVIGDDERRTVDLRVWRWPE